jgi:hypothetical protein
MNLESEKKISYLWEYLVTAGYLLLFCALTFGCAAFFYVNRSLYSPLSRPPYEFATNLPPRTATPHIPSIDPFKAETPIFRDDFSNNDHQWLSSQDETKEKLDSDRLFFQARNEDGYGLISCDDCPYLESSYYLEASLSTNLETDDDYGLAFKRSKTLDDFYIFIINPESKKYALWHHTPDDWSFRSSGETNLIRPYPESNTLGLYASKDFIELYINGEIIDSYTESNSSFDTGYFGFYANASWFGVYVDNVVIYEIGK